MQAHLPLENLSSLKQELSSAIDRESMLKRDLRTMANWQFATRVIKPGRPFLDDFMPNKMLATIHKVRLNLAAQVDIVWWYLPYGSKFCIRNFLYIILYLKKLNFQDKIFMN